MDKWLKWDNLDQLQQEVLRLLALPSGSSSETPHFYLPKDLTSDEILPGPGFDEPGTEVPSKPIGLGPRTDRTKYGDIDDEDLPPVSAAAVKLGLVQSAAVDPPPPPPVKVVSAKSSSS